MERVTNNFLTDMHLIYRLAEGNARAAERLYHERDSSSQHRTPSIEQNVLVTVRRSPSTSIRAVAAASEESRSSVHRVLQREGLHTHTIYKEYCHC
ncbi:hypothetical protein TNCV_4652441 [Trichonephila clavipes]|nr:hypothetical protein TNCV_4652441 [Trichonephila clavipes]